MILSNACNGMGSSFVTNQETSSHTTTPTPVPDKTSSVFDKEPQTTQTEVSGVLLKLTTDKTIYNSGETVRVTASVENLTTGPIAYTLSSIGIPIPSVCVQQNKYFGTIGLYEEGQGIPTLQPLVVVHHLEPESKISRDVVWDQKYGGVQAPPEIFQIGCYITLGDIYQDEESLVTVSTVLNIEIINAPGWVTAEQAKSIALAIPEIAQWREKHSGKYLVKEEPDGFYLLESGEWVKVSPEIIIDTESGQSLTLEELSGWMPEPLVLFDDEAWLVTMATKLGNPPVFVKVWIDLHDGSVRDVQIY